MKLAMALGLVVGIILIVSWRLAELKDPPEGLGEDERRDQGEAVS